MSQLRVTHGTNDLVHADDGVAYIDLISSTGAVFLGHANERVNRYVADQLGRISCSWTAVMDVQDRCKQAMAELVEPRLRLHSLYSSGMEAAEVAMRIAFHATGRRAIIGFRNNHHGKSVATQNITGPDPDLPCLEAFHPLPFIPERSEGDILEAVAKELASTDAAAIFLEPLQGRGGGHSASANFYDELQRMCRSHGVLVICDEIFSGFHRTGPCFRYPALGIEPDVVLVGKAVANGFPAAGVLLDAGLTFHPKDFRLSSTFSDNPLACAAVLGTLAEMGRIGVEERVAHIEGAFADLDGGPAAQLRLHGAACFLELTSEGDASAVHDHLFRNRVLALQRGPVLGFWPPATITDDHLRHVVDVANDSLASLR